MCSERHWICWRDGNYGSCGSNGNCGCCGSNVNCWSNGRDWIMGVVGVMEIVGLF